MCLGHSVLRGVAGQVQERTAVMGCETFMQLAHAQQAAFGGVVDNTHPPYYLGSVAGGRVPLMHQAQAHLRLGSELIETDA